MRQAGRSLRRLAPSFFCSTWLWSAYRLTRWGSTQSGPTKNSSSRNALMSRPSWLLHFARVEGGSTGDLRTIKKPQRGDSSGLFRFVSDDDGLSFGGLGLKLKLMVRTCSA